MSRMPSDGGNIHGMLACASHWYESLMYVAPVAGVLVFLKVMSVRDRRAEEAEEREADRSAEATPPALLAPHHG